MLRFLVVLFFAMPTLAADDFRELKGSGGPVRGAKFTPDGMKIVSCTGWPKGDGVVRIWDVKTGKVLTEMKGHEGNVDGLTLSVDGKYAATGGHDNTARVWDITTGKEKFVLKGHTLEIPGLAFSPDGKLLATVSHDKLIKLWDLTTGKEKKELKGSTGQLRCVAFYDEGKKLIVGDWDMTISVWNIATGKVETSWKAEDKVNTLAIVPKTKTVVVGHGRIGHNELDTGKELKSITGHQTPITVVAVSPDGKHVASGTYNGDFRVWNLESGKEVARFQAHIGACWTLDFSPDGKTIVSGGSGGFVNDKAEPGDDFAIRIWKWEE